MTTTVTTLSPLRAICEKLTAGEPLPLDSAGRHTYFDPNTCRMERVAPTIRGLYLFLFATLTEREIHMDLLALELLRINLMHNVPVEKKHLQDLCAMVPVIERIISDLSPTDAQILATDIALARHKDAQFLAATVNQ